jgi:hypothetical protein
VNDGAICGRQFDTRWLRRPANTLPVHIPVPGMLTFRYTPFGPMLMLNGAAPSVALRPRAVRFNFTPGNTLKVLRKRQLMRNLRFPSNAEALAAHVITAFDYYASSHGELRHRGGQSAPTILKENV